MEDGMVGLPQGLREMAERHLVLLESQNRKRKRDTVQLSLSGYSDVMFLIADLVKVCILALGTELYEGGSHISEPQANISGVLGIVLDLVPYEEAELLDKIREAVLELPSVEQDTKEDEMLIENYFLTPPGDLDLG